MKQRVIIICVLLYALAVSAALVWSTVRKNAIYVFAPAIERHEAVSWAVASALTAVKQEKLLRSSVHKLTAVRDKYSTNTWVVTFLFEDPPIIGGDVIATVHADGKVTVVPGF